METNELDLSLVFTVLRKRLIWILLAAIIFGGLAFGVSYYVMTPQYTATMKMYVYSDPDRESGTSMVTTSELSASKSLLDTYMVILESDTVLDKVIQDLSLSCSAGELRKMLDSASINSTEVFSVSVTCSNPKTAQTIANTIADVAPAEIIRVVKAGGVEVVDYAKLPEAPSSPDVKKYAAVGALLGFVLFFGLFLLGAMMDTKIHNEEDLTKNFDLPVLGSIPTFSTASTDQKYGGREG